MALEVPVLATNVGGPPELIHDGREGYLLPPDEPAAWAQAVQRIVESPERGRELGRAGRLRIAQAFDVGDHVTEVLDVYRRAMARDRRDGQRRTDPPTKLGAAHDRFSGWAR
jgi:glycosyltransferase involved in cell wall biosynthesis